MIKKGKQKESPFWISVSDLMSAVLLIFILVTMSLMYELSSSVRVKSRVYQLLSERLKEAGLKTDIDSRSGTISIADTVLFESNEALFKSGSKIFLNKLIPIISDVLLSDVEIEKEVYAVDIEGYASEQGHMEKDMMILSLQRSLGVWLHIYDMNQFPNKKKFLKIIKVCGWGNMKATDYRDLPKDRRVVFQLQFRGTMKRLESLLMDKTL